MQGSEIKGICIKSSMELLAEHDLLTDTLIIMPDYHREPIAAGVVPGIWYPIGVHLGMLDSIHFGPTDDLPDIFAAMGSRAVFDGVNSMLKGFVRIGDPDWLLRRANIFWRKLVTGAVMEVTEYEHGQATLHITGPAMAYRRFCRFSKGAITEVLELCGADQVKVQLKDFTVNEVHTCRFDVSWIS